MRTLSAQAVTQAVCDLFLQACACPGEDVRLALSRAHQQESSPLAKELLSQLLDNLRVAKEKGWPACQDTGLAVVFADIGQDVHIQGAYFEDAVNAGVRRAYAEGYFRKSVASPLSRVNTGDNTPAVIHTRILPGDRLTLTAAPKGFGSENMSALCMLTPAQGLPGILDFVLRTVQNAGSKPCPPIVVGVGIGGTMEQAALLAKRTLIREVGAPSDDPELAQLERTLLARINALGIGPMGMGGDTTALAVHAAACPTHIAGLPVAVNIQCHAARHASITL